MVNILPSLPRSYTTLHDKIIGALPTPYWLIRCTLLDNKWTIRLGDAAADETIVLDFDQPITPWPDLKSLIAPAFECDLITLKMLVVLSLKPAPLGWVNSIKSLPGHVVGPYLDFVRWRIDRGVPNNQSLNAAWFNDYDSSLKRNWREGLLNVKERAISVVNAIEGGLIKLPVDCRGDIAGDAIAKLLGLRGATSITPEARQYIEEYFQKINHPYSRNSRGRETPEPTRKNVVSTSAVKHYKLWFDLWRLRSHLSHDPIGYRCFKRSNDVAKHCGNFFRQSLRTKDAPGYQTSYLINASLKILLDPVATNLIELVRQGVNEEGCINNKKLLLDCNERLAGLGFPVLSDYYHLKSARNVEGATLHQVVFRVLPMAARFVTAAFSARRDGEISSSKLDCIHRDKYGNPMLRCYISKNMRRLQSVPVPESVAKAVEVVLMVRGLGNETSNKLYDFWCPILKRKVGFETKELTSFVRDYFQTPLLDDGTAWHFRPHQFRKFFGVTYFWRYAFPNLTALTFHYRHFNPETTRGYIEMEAAQGLRMRDEKLAAAARKEAGQRKVDFESSKSAFVEWVLNGVAAGNALGGALGERITAQVEKLKKEFLPELKITGAQTSSTSFDKALAALAKTTSLQVHPEGHSLCGWGSGSDGISAHRCVSRCLELRSQLTGVSSREALGPDFAYAEDTGCLICPLRAALPTMAPRWENEVRDAEFALSHSNTDQVEIVRERLEIISAHVGSL